MPSLSQEKSCPLPKSHKGPKLSSCGTTDPWICVYSWDPYTKSNILQLEAVQRRAARFVTGDYRTTSSPLDQRRASFKLVMAYRITYRLIDIPVPLYLHPSAWSTRGHTLHDTTLKGRCLSDSFSHQQSGCRTSCRSLLQLPQPSVTSRWGWPATDNFILLLTCTLFEPYDHLVHSSPQCDNVSEKAMNYIGRRIICNWTHPLSPSVVI